jgi:hypothetical protein
MERVNCCVRAFVLTEACAPSFPVADTVTDAQLRDATMGSVITVQLMEPPVIP